jgi:spermidine/putrescine transport system ATP-binding protein
MTVVTTLIVGQGNKTTMVALIELKHVTKQYDGVTVLRGIDLTIEQNEFVTLLGPSGCGKTTLLRIIGGFEEPRSGDVRFEGESMLGVPPHQRPTNTVFQRYALFPHLNVFENVAFGLRVKQGWFTSWNQRKARKNRETEIRKNVLKYLKLVGLEGYESRNVVKLSGGQQQRVAIARALINEPKVLLLDEPLAALDLKLRQEMQYELKEIQRNTGITFVFVTHDQEEALTMSDRIVVMNHGEIQQVGTPVEIYNTPVNTFVASFVGESNLFEGIMTQDNHVSFDGARYPCTEQGFQTEEPVDILIRPEDIDIVERGSGLIPGVVESVIFKGVHYEMDVRTNHRTYTIHTTDHVDLHKEVDLAFEPADLHLMRKSV